MEYQKHLTDEQKQGLHKSAACIKYRRLQLPLVVACARTIHKSEGVIFNQFVYYSHKNHKQQFGVCCSETSNKSGGIFS